MLYREILCHIIDISFFVISYRYQSMAGQLDDSLERYLDQASGISKLKEVSREWYHIVVSIILLSQYSIYGNKVCKMVKICEMKNVCSGHESPYG